MLSNRLLTINLCELTFHSWLWLDCWPLWFLLCVSSQSNRERNINHQEQTASKMFTENEVWWCTSVVLALLEAEAGGTGVGASTGYVGDLGLKWLNKQINVHCACILCGCPLSTLSSVMVFSLFNHKSDLWVRKAGGALQWFGLNVPLNCRWGFAVSRHGCPFESCRCTQWRGPLLNTKAELNT